MTETQLFEIGEHEYEIDGTFEDGSMGLYCRDCGHHQYIEGDTEDTEGTLELMAPDVCKRVVVRHATSNRDGLAVVAAHNDAVVLEKFDMHDQETNRMKITASDRSEVAHVIENLEEDHVF